MFNDHSTHPLVGFAMFLLVWFLYLHITAQWKTGEDLEVYETDYHNPTQYHEACAVRQPVVFMMRPHVHPIFDRVRITHMQKYYANTVCVRDTTDPAGAGMELPLQTAITLTERDPHAKYISEFNQPFIEESSLANLFLDEYIRPAFTIHKSYDVMFGSKGASTPLRYHTKSMKCLLVTSGQIHVKLTPWKSRKYLYPVKDYNWYEFRSDVDLWRACPQQVHCLELNVSAGMMLYIPPYWFYTVKYSSDTSTTVASMEYVTGINAMSNLNDLVVYYANVQGFGNTPAQSTTQMDMDTPLLTAPDAPPPLVHPSQTSATVAANPTPPVITPTLTASVLDTPTQKNEEIVTNAGVYRPWYRTVTNGNPTLYGKQ